MNDFIFHGSLSDLDPAVSQLVEIEAQRQAQKLILIPSESAAPAAVREALDRFSKTFTLKVIPTKNSA